VRQAFPVVNGTRKQETLTCASRLRQLRRVPLGHRHLPRSTRPGRDGRRQDEQARAARNRAKATVQYPNQTFAGQVEKVGILADRNLVMSPNVEFARIRIECRERGQGWPRAARRFP
jgi:hypothetical protein